MSKTLFKGTWEEAINHAGDIPRNQIVVISAVTEANPSEEENAFGGKSVAGILQEIGFAEGLPEDLSVNPKYREGFGETKNQKTKAKHAPSQFASAWEYLQSFEPQTHTPEEWEEIERQFRGERNAWGD